MKNSVFLLVFLLVSAAAGGQSFRLPAVPDSLRTPESRASYLVAHYWENVPINICIGEGEELEQAVVNYIDLFRLVPAEVAEASLRKTMVEAGRDEEEMFAFYNLFEKYLYDLDSPMRDEGLFIPVLESLLASPLLAGDDRIRPEYLLAMARKNRVGTRAEDFTLLFRDGNRCQLGDLPRRTTLLYFYDPDCDDCRAATRKLGADEALNRLIEADSLQVVAVYTGEDTERWREDCGHIPSNWLCACDEGQRVLNEELYDLKAFPTLYLLDGEKRVMLKEAATEDLIRYLTH